MNVSLFDDIVKNIFNAALAAVDPYRSVREHTEYIRSEYVKGDCSSLSVVGFGKAACAMAHAVEDDLADLITDGIVVTRYGHVNHSRLRVQGSRVKLYEAGHPVPDENGLEATEAIVSLMRGKDKRALILCLISGGGSALFVSPAEGITLKEKQVVTDMLLMAGADIFELNTVRKHISRVKGGRFAEIAYPSRMITLIISDVIGDRLDVIASGPTSPDRTTFEDAFNVLDKYYLTNKVPYPVVSLLQRGREGLIPDTPKTGNRIFERIDNLIIGNNSVALARAKEKAEKLGFHTHIISTRLNGESRDAGRVLAQKVKGMKKNISRPTCLLSGGETTVNVRGSGKGGRNMELALSFALEIEGIGGITLLSAGTDGTDGPTDAAGAVVDGNTMINAKKKGIIPDKYLRNNDSYTFFSEVGGLFTTGPTGTNVMDIAVMVIE